MKKSARIVLLILIIFLTISSFISPSQAYWIERQKGVPVKKNFELGPTSFQIKGNPGDEFERELSVTNRLGKKMGFVVEVEDFSGSSDPSKPSVLFQGTGPFSAKNWIKPERWFFILKQGEKAHLKVFIKIPKVADPGEHYAGVLIKNRNVEPIKKGVATIRLSSRLGSMFLIDAGGKRVEKSSFVDFKTSKKFYHNGPVKFGLVASSYGNTHLEPRGIIIIKNMMGKITAEVPVRKWIVLRQSKRLQEAVFKRKWLFGKYTATATIWWGAKEKQEKKQLNFYAFPYRTTSFLLIALSIAAFLTNSIYKRLRSKYKLTLKFGKRKKK